jgi:hypothetical protein
MGGGATFGGAGLIVVSYVINPPITF